METPNKVGIAIPDKLQLNARLTDTVLAFVRLDADGNRGEVTHELKEAIKKRTEIIASHITSNTGAFALQVTAQDLGAFSHFALQSLFNQPNVKDPYASFSSG